MTSGECPEKWKLDVNDRYQKAVGFVISLSSTSLFIPILFLKDIVAVNKDKAIVSVLDGYVYVGWFLLGMSILTGILYCYFSAKWAKQAWKQSADVMWYQVTPKQVEYLLDWTYFLMMAGFLGGIFCMIKFVTTYVISTPQ